MVGCERRIPRIGEWGWRGNLFVDDQLSDGIFPLDGADAVGAAEVDILRVIFPIGAAVVSTTWVKIEVFVSAKDLIIDNRIPLLTAHFCAGTAGVAGIDMVIDPSQPFGGSDGWASGDGTGGVSGASGLILDASGGEGEDERGYDEERGCFHRMNESTLSSWWSVRRK